MNKCRIRSILSCFLILTMLVSFFPENMVNATGQEKYLHTLYAASVSNDAIVLNASNMCINGNIETNGKISKSNNVNINGKSKEQSKEKMIDCSSALNTKYFENVSSRYFQDYFIEDNNINIDKAIEVIGNVDIKGDVNLNTAIKAIKM